MSAGGLVSKLMQGQGFQKLPFQARQLLLEGLASVLGSLDERGQAEIIGIFPALSKGEKQNPSSVSSQIVSFIGFGLLDMPFRDLHCH